MLSRPGQIAGMSKAKNSRAEGKVELGRYIVADPAICHGNPAL